MLAGGVAWIAFLFFMFSKDARTPPLVPMLLRVVPGLVLLPFAFIRRKVTAGFDGVYVQWLWMTFLPYAKLMRARPMDNDGVALLFRGGGGEIEARGPAAKALLDRVWLAMEARAHQAVQPAEVAFLERGTRSVPEWIAALSRLSASADAYRGVAMSRDRLWAVVESPAAASELRAAAAAALAPTLDPPAKRHLRVVADQAEAPALRAAIVAAADGVVDESDYAAFRRVTEE